MAIYLLNDELWKLPDRLLDELLLPEPWYWDWENALAAGAWPGINKRNYAHSGSLNYPDAWGWIHYNTIAHCYWFGGRPVSTYVTENYTSLEDAVRQLYLLVMLGAYDET